MSSREEGAVNRVSWSEATRWRGAGVINVLPRREEQGTREEIPPPPPSPLLVCFILDWLVEPSGKREERKTRGENPEERRSWRGVI